MAKTNVNGGAIAIGHPGARPVLRIMMTTDVRASPSGGGVLLLQSVGD